MAGYEPELPALRAGDVQPKLLVMTSFQMLQTIDVGTLVTTIDVTSNVDMGWAAYSPDNTLVLVAKKGQVASAASLACSSSFSLQVAATPRSSRPRPSSRNALRP